MYDLRGSVVSTQPRQILPRGIIARRVVADPELPPAGRTTQLIEGRFVFADMPDGVYELRVDSGSLEGRVRVVVDGRAPDSVTLTYRPPR